MQKPQQGFTVLELLVGLLTFSLLATLGAQATKEYKDRAQYASAEAYMHSARVALEAGKVEMDDVGGWHWIWQTTSGPIIGAMGQRILPGLQIPANTWVYVSYDPDCNFDWCMTEYVWIRNCKSTRYSYWYKFANGYEFQQRNILAGWNC